jgi:hypothetical protein
MKFVQNERVASDTSKMHMIRGVWLTLQDVPELKC